MLAVFLKKVGWTEQVQRCLPIQWKSPNAMAAGETLTAFIVAVRERLREKKSSLGRCLIEASGYTFLCDQ